jgi:hypothetical protein
VLRTLRLLEELTNREHELGTGDLDGLCLEHGSAQPARPEPRVHDEAHEELRQRQPHTQIQHVVERSIARSVT